MVVRFEERFQIRIDAVECMDSIKQLGNLTYATIFAGITSYYMKLINCEEKQIIGEAESVIWTKIPDFLEMFPHGKAMLLIRDLRDILVSFKKITIAPGNDYLISIFKTGI